MLGNVSETQLRERVFCLQKSPSFKMIVLKAIRVAATHLRNVYLSLLSIVNCCRRRFPPCNLICPYCLGGIYPFPNAFAYAMFKHLQDDPRAFPFRSNSTNFCITFLDTPNFSTLGLRVLKFTFWSHIWGSEGL